MQFEAVYKQGRSKPLSPLSSSSPEQGHEPPLSAGKLIEKIVRRLVEGLRVEQIILFGSLLYSGRPADCKPRERKSL